MPSGVVQFREDAAVLAYLRKRGLNPNEVAREALERTCRRMRAEEANRWLEKHGARGIDWAKRVREDRDSH